MTFQTQVKTNAVLSAAQGGYDMFAIQSNDSFQFQPRGASDFWFACVDIEVIRDKTLSPCDKAVFAVICTHVNVQTRDCPLRVKTIAEEANCSVRSAQESLKALTERGVIERVECFENGKQKASIYKIVGHRAQCYRGADFAPTFGSRTGRGAESDVLSLLEPNIYDIKNTSPYSLDLFKKNPYKRVIYEY